MNAARERSFYDEARYRRHQREVREVKHRHRIRALTEREITLFHEAITKARRTPADERRGMST